MTTKEDAKIAYVNNQIFSGSLTKTDIIEQVFNAFDKGVEFAQRWIPVEEELPEIGVEVLVKVDDLTGSNHPNGIFLLDYTVSIAFNAVAFSCEIDYSGKTVEKVTHWHFL